MSVRTGVALLTLGGPRTRDEIPAFLRRLTGRELPPPAAASATARYDRIGGSSPLDAITERQAAALQLRLGPDFLCRAAFLHSDPSIETQVAALLGAGVERLALLPASPFWSSVTTGEQLARARAAVASAAWRGAVSELHSWCADDAFVALWADRIAGAEPDPEATYVFAAHSLPERLAGEPYRGQIESAASAIAARAGLPRWTVGWQSVPVGAREPWIGPAVEEVFARLAGEGVPGVVEVPLGFTADHVETLFDIDVLHRQRAAELKLAWRRLPSLNDDPRFIDVLARIVAEGSPA